MRPTPDIERAIKSMRPLPNVAHRVLQIVQDPDYAIDELTAVVRTDPSLSARVLRLCNSARSGLSVEIASIQDAVSYLGTRSLVQLVLVTCSASLYTAPRRTSYFEPAALWQHAVACGVTCQLLAAKTEVPAATAFTAGVLHDIGTLVLDQLVTPERVARALAAAAGQRPDLIDFERDCFGIDHATANGMVTEAWGLAPSLARAMACHHLDPIRGEALPDDDALPSILHVAEQLVARSAVGCTVPSAIATIDERALCRLALDPEQLEVLSARATEDALRLAEVLNLHATRGR